MREQRIRQLLHQIAEEAVPPGLDGWPAVRARLHPELPAAPAAPRAPWRQLRSGGGRRATPRAVGTALLALLLLGGGLWTSPPARAQLGQLAWLVPGLGLRETDAPGLTAIAPTTMERDGLALTVSTLHSTGDRTLVRLQIAGVPLSLPAEQWPVGQVRLTMRDEAGRVYPPGRGPSGQGIVPQGPATPGVPRTTLTFGIEQAFAPLDPATRAVEVQVAGPPPIGTRVVRVPVIPEAEAGLATARAGGSAATIGDVTVRVTGVAADGQELAVQLAVQPGPATHAVRALDDGFRPGRRLVLRDDRGREVIERTPSFSPPSADAAGVLRDDLLFPQPPTDARSATLLIPSVTVAETGETAPLRVPLAGARPGDQIPLTADLALGPYLVRVTGAEIVEERGERKLLLHLDLGTGPPGRRLLGFEHVTLDGRERSPSGTLHTATGHYGGSAQARAIELPLPIGIGSAVTITLRDPLVAVDGPWQLDIPLPTER